MIVLLFEGGQWDSSDCDTHIMTGSVMCSCSATGSVAVLQVSTVTYCYILIYTLSLIISVFIGNIN